MYWLFMAIVGLVLGFGTSEQGAKAGFILGAVICFLFAVSEQNRGAVSGYYQQPEVNEVQTLDYQP